MGQDRLELSDNAVGVIDAIDDLTDAVNRVLDDPSREAIALRFAVAIMSNPTTQFDNGDPRQVAVVMGIAFTQADAFLKARDSEPVK